MYSRRSTRASLLAGSTRRGPNAHAFREKSLILANAVDEYLRLKQSGIEVDVGEFCERYPQYQHSLRRLISVEEGLGFTDPSSDGDWPKPGECFLDFAICEVLGTGSIACVYLAQELKLGGRPVAIKVSQHGDYEAETLGKLQHPNIVDVYSVNYDETTGLTAVCMPYRGSATLADVLDAAYAKSTGPRTPLILLDVARKMAIDEALPEGERALRPDQVLTRGSFADAVVHLGTQLASALQFAHERGVLHRDLKPSNVLLTPQGRPLVLDFNLSYDSALNVVHQGATLPYAAPEQLREAFPENAGMPSAVGPAADVFSLGAILYELLTGQLPFGSPPATMAPQQAVRWQLESLERPARPLRELKSAIDHKLNGVVLRCLEADPRRRYGSMGELKAALERHFRWSARTGRWLRRHARLVVASAALVAVLISAGVVHVANLPPYHLRQYHAANEALRTGEIRQAVRYLDAAIASQPAFGEARHLLGTAWARLGEPARAIEAFQKAREHIADPLSVQSDLDNALFQRGVAYQKAGNHEQAIADFKGISLAFEPKDTLFDCLGYSLFQMRRYMDAYGAFRKAGRDNPTYEILLKRSFAIYSATRQLQGLESLDAAIALDPTRYEAYLLRGQMTFEVLSAKKLPLDAAIADAQRAIELAPDSPAAALFAAQVTAAASPSIPEATELRSQLLRAVNLGWPRSVIETVPAFHPWKDEGWFRSLLDECSLTRESPRPALTDIAVAPPLLDRTPVQ